MHGYDAYPTRQYVYFEIHDHTYFKNVQKFLKHNKYITIIQWLGIQIKI